MCMCVGSVSIVPRGNHALHHSEKVFVAHGQAITYKALV